MAKALFDRDEVIDKTMMLFWENGYNASSMQQIVDTTGLKPGSIYHSFGSKEKLFREVLNNYTSKSLARIRMTMDGASSVGEGLCQHLENVAEQTVQTDYYSCLLVKTQLELSYNTRSNSLHALTSMKLSEIEELFTTYLEREFNIKMSTERATSIMLHIFGIRVYGFHNRYRKDATKQMCQGMRTGLPWLPWK